MKISGFKRINKEDFDADSQALIEKISFSINPFAEELISLLNGKLNINDNFNQVIKELTVILNSDGTPKQTTQFKKDTNGRTKGISVLRTENQTNVNTYSTNAPFLTYSENGDIITIKHITGLQADNKWKITLLCIGEF